MVDEWIVSETKVKGITHFFVPDISILKKYMNTKKDQLQKLEDNFSLIETELSQYDQNKYSYIPKITLFDGVDWIKNIYNDIYDVTINDKLLIIKFFATNTFESQVSVNKTLKDYYEDLFIRLQKKKVSIDAFLWNGILIMEHISKTTNIQNLPQLPAWNSTINIFIVWWVVYIIIFKEVPFGIKIDSKDLANVMHFMFEKLQLD